MATTPEEKKKKKLKKKLRPTVRHPRFRAAAVFATSRTGACQCAWR